MKKWISILSVLLVVQLVLAAAVNFTGRDYGTFQAEERMLDFDPQQVGELRIDDGEDSVILSKQGGKWVLPENGNFAANEGAIERLLDKLAAFKKGWPVATSSGALRRFKVAEGTFERRFTLSSPTGETLAQLYIGTSPGFRKVHARPAADTSVFAVEFNAWEANAKLDDWIDKEILRLDEDDLVRIEMPGFVLQREEGEFQLPGLGENEEISEEAVRSLLGKLAGLRVQSLLGTEPEAEYRQEEPALEIKVVRKGGEVLSYRFSKPEETAYYVLKRSDLDHYFKIADLTVEPILDTERGKLVLTREKEEPTEKPGEEKDAEAGSDTAG